MDVVEKIKNIISPLQFYLVILLILILPLGELTRIDLGNAAAFTLNDVVVGLLTGGFVFDLVVKRKSKAALTKPILLFVLVCFLSLLLNYSNLTKNEFLTSLSYAVRWFCYATIYFTVVGLEKPRKRKILNLLLVSGLVTILVGFIQLLLYPNLRNLFYAGWDEHLYRIFNSFLDPNFTGVIFVLLFILLTTKLYPNFNKLTNSRKLLSGFFLLAIFLAIVLTFSRTAAMALGMVTIAFTIITRDKRIVLIALLLAMLAGTVFFLSPRKESNNVLRTTSTFARFDNYKEGISIFSHDPVLGVGFNAYRYALEKYGFKQKELYGPSHGGAGNDNSFIFALATTGILGIFCYIYLILKMFKTPGSGKTLRDLSLLAVIVGSLFINALFFVFIMEWLWIVFGTTENT